MIKKEILEQREFSLLIIAYRKFLIQRYSTENLKRFPEFETIPRVVVDKLVSYFLDLLYPEIEKRKELDNAFRALANFVHTPEKIFGLLGSIGVILFKFGKQFFSATKAGVAALRSYVKANQFEESLYEYAKLSIEKGRDISEEVHFKRLIGRIEKKEADEFREQIISLFKTLSNQSLLIKVEEVLEYVSDKMKSKKDVYSEQDIEGILLGRMIIQKGKSIFTELDQKQIDLVIRAIDKIEEDFYLNCL